MGGKTAQKNHWLIKRMRMLDEHDTMKMKSEVVKCSECSCPSVNSVSMRLGQRAQSSSFLH